MKKIAVLIGMLILFSGFHPIIETPYSITKGEVYCHICKRIMMIYDGPKCIKAEPMLPDRMAFALCNLNVREPVVVSCPFDDGILHLKEE